MQRTDTRQSCGAGTCGFPLLLACCLAAATAVAAFAAEDGGGFGLAANMVLNRSVFLSWEEAPEEGFGRYEVYAGPASEPLPERPVAELEEAGHCYLSLRGLEPETEYAARVRLVPADGRKPIWSHTVHATTCRDAHPDGTSPWRIRVPVLMYHHVRPRDAFPPRADPGTWVSTENFERDLAWMKAHGVHTVTTADILDGRLPENPVFLTFDDGYVDFLECAVPLLSKYGFAAANAVVTRLTGGHCEWVEEDLDTLMTWPQIRRCLQAGMEIGGHTQTHVDLHREPEKIGQVRGSFDDLAGALGEPPLYFCYPWGMGGHDIPGVKDAVRAAGYRMATRTWPPGDALLASDMFFFPRQFASGDDTLEDFLRKTGFLRQEERTE